MHESFGKNGGLIRLALTWELICEGNGRLGSLSLNAKRRSDVCVSDGFSGVVDIARVVVANEVGCKCTDKSVSSGCCINNIHLSGTDLLAACAALDMNVRAPVKALRGDKARLFSPTHGDEIK